MSKASTDSVWSAGFLAGFITSSGVSGWSEARALDDLTVLFSDHPGIAAAVTTRRKALAKDVR